jgi:hypothetical protein
MMALNRFILGTALTLMLGACATEGSAPNNVLVAESQTISYRDGTALRENAWTLNPDLNPDVYAAAVDEGAVKEVCFISGPNELCRDVELGESYAFGVVYEGVTYPHRIDGTRPQATFTKSYQDGHRGKITVLTDDIYELVNIAIALTDFVDQPDYDRVVYKDTDYHRDLQEHFAPVEDHPFVLWLNEEMTENYQMYWQHKMNGYAFVEADDGGIARSPVYGATGFTNAQNTLLPAMKMMDDFAKTSDYKAFLDRHRDLLREQTDFMRDGLGAPEMLAWLKGNFPRVDAYDHVKVVFSPLVYGWQSVTWMESNGFKELQPHLNFPYASEFDQTLSPQGQALSRGSLLFTEINHGFINPAAEDYADRLTAALSDRKGWDKEGAASASYSSPQALFNEMMNWGLIPLYYADNADPEELGKMTDNIVEIMTENRGFLRFGELMPFLMDLYVNRPEGTTLQDLYPEIVGWFEVNANS